MVLVDKGIVDVCVQVHGNNGNAVAFSTTWHAREWDRFHLFGRLGLNEIIAEVVHEKFLTGCSSWG